ncbi:MAG TPA: hypothetical protein VG318_13835 [Actinomycetota bacterium]|nr:hypothetical protein [Actinomycetota bacterium]
MKKSLKVVLTGMLLAANVGLFAAPASAMTCQTNDEYIPPEVGEPACEVFLTVMRPICSKFPCG